MTTVIPQVGRLAAKMAQNSVHPGSVAPAPSARARTNQFLNTLGSPKPGMAFNAS